MRKGITLLITLSVIAAMFGLLGILFSSLESARKKAEEKAATLQADLLREDLTNLLHKYLKSKPSVNTLQTLYSTPLPLYGNGGDFGLLAQCGPLFDRIPISWLGFDENPKRKERYELAKTLFERLTDEAQLRDPSRLYEMLRNALRGTRIVFGEEAWLQPPKGAMNEHSFKRILDEYRFLADDPSVYTIDWKGYFLLQNLEGYGQGLDRDFLAPKVVAYLYDLEPTLVEADYVPGQLNTFLESVGADKKRYSRLFRPQKSPAMRCEGRVTFREGQYNIGFDYLDGRIARFEFQTP